ncbi:transposase-like protein [Arthrobacter globiformis]|nr:transposase-like protein [Arthrobacter globiformis]
MLIACCDGLTGFPEAIQATWANTTVQTCVVHLSRSSMRFVAYGDRKKSPPACASSTPPPTIEAAVSAREDFAAGELGRKYPAAVKTWENAWERFIPFLAFPPALRKVIYTTNATESLNYQLRKIIKNCGHFPNDQAAVKLLWRSATSKINAPGNAARAGPLRRNQQKTISSKAQPPPAGSRPWES